ARPDRFVAAGPVRFRHDAQPVPGQPGGAAGQLHAGHDAVGLRVRPAQRALGNTGYQPVAARDAFHEPDQDAAAGGRLLARHLARHGDSGGLRPGAGLGYAAHAAQETSFLVWTELMPMDALLAPLAQIASLIRKELLALIKEPASRAILLMPVLVQALLFGYGATYDLRHVPYAVLDQSRGAASTELLARLDGTGVFVREATLTSSRQIAQVIDEQRALLVLAIPSDFDEGLAGGRRVALQVIFDGR